jgi:GNAT superfamily N-acetyltransferase
MTYVLETASIHLATDSAQIRACYKVMHQLRPHLTSEQAFIEQVQRQIQGGYHLAYLEDGAQVKAVTGFRFLEFLAWGKVIYIDDLVSDAATRRNGYGSKLLKWVINEAKKAKCDQIHLDSGPQRYDAHRLYLNHGFKIIAHHFSLDLKEQS